MKILFLSDTQLGAGSALTQDRLRDQERILMQAADLADQHGCQTVVHCGDVYEHRHPSEEARMVFKRFTRRLAQRLIVIAGNHDLTSADTPSSVDVHDGFEFVRRDEVVDLGDASLACLPWTPSARVVAAREIGDRQAVNQQMSEYLLGAASDLYSRCPPGKPAILGLHWWIEEATTASGLHSSVIDEPMLPLSDLAAIGFDAVIAGHVHKSQVLHISPPVLYVGAPSVSNYGEADIEHGVWILDTDAPDRMKFVPLQDWRFVTVDVDLTEEVSEPETYSPGPRRPPEDVGDAEAALRSGSSGSLTSLDPTDLIVAAITGLFPLYNTVLRVRYTATEEQHRRVDPAAIRKLALDAGAHKVYAIEPTIVRQQRVRVEGFDRSLDAHGALDAWCDANGVTAAPLHEILAVSREKSASAVMSGGTFDPLRLTGKNIGRFPELDVELTDGATVLLGANGSGKSTVLAALELALYAEDAGALREILAPWADGLELSLEFTLNGDLHRARRTLRGATRSEAGVASGGKATLDFEVDKSLPGDPPGPYWVTLTRETAKATQQLLTQTLGMSRTLFRASCFLAQGDAPAFLKAEPRDRKALAAEMLDPAGLWAADAKYASGLVKSVADEIGVTNGQIQDREERLIGTEDLAARVTELIDQKNYLGWSIAVRETTLSNAQKELSENAVAAERVKTSRLARDTAAADEQRALEAVTRARQAVDDLPGATDTLERLRVEAEKIDGLEEQAAKQASLIAERQTLIDAKKLAEEKASAAIAAASRLMETYEQAGKEHANVSARLAHLRQAEDGAERCRECEQVLGSEARLAAIDATHRVLNEIRVRQTEAGDEAEQALAYAKTLKDKVAALVIPSPIALTDFDTPLRRARQAAAGIPVAEQNLDTVSARADSLPEAVAAHEVSASTLTDAESVLTAALKNVKDEETLTAAVTTAQAELDRLRTELHATSNDLARTRERVDQAAKLTEETANLTIRRTELQAQLDLYRTAERAFGRDGIPVLLLETVIDQIDTDANAVLRRFPTDDGWTFQVRFETQREQATTDRVKEELFVMVSAPDYTQDFRSLSGGEESRVAFGVRVALAMLLSRLRGADSRVLVLDELSFLDEGGEERLVGLIGELVSDGTFSKVITVSHSPNVRDAFEQTIEIRKRDGVSEIVEAVAMVAS